MTGRNEVERDKKFVRQLERDFTEVKFVWGAARFAYRLKNGVATVFLGPPCPNFGLLALHEFGHALCKHKDYKVDVRRLKIESEAWEMAKTVFLKYQKRAAYKDGWWEGGEKMVKNNELVKILPEWDEEFVQDQLDSYRDWLHTKSRCKKCGLTRYQTEDGKYHCPRCENFALYS